MSTNLNRKILGLENLLSEILTEMEALTPMKFDEYRGLILEKIYDFTDKLSLAEEIPFGDIATSDSEYDYYHEDEIEHYVDDEELN